MFADEPPEFLPAQQRADFVKQNLTKAVRTCRHIIASSPDGFDAADAHRVLGRILEKMGDAAGAAASFAQADGSAADVTSSASKADEAEVAADVSEDAGAVDAAAADAASTAAGKSKKKKKKGKEQAEVVEDEDALLAAAIAESAALRHEASEATAAAPPAAAAPTPAHESAVSSSTVSSSDADGAPPPRQYRWADPLPDPERHEAFAAMGVRPGALLTEADLIGMRACGGPDVVVATGLIMEVS